ncbi:MAG: class I SAM-dependent methyltransferase [Rhodospirillaceae bacterium]|jgi:SAM-dependent methyltransferase|nr:class I SAM-dependent methyltransferase [Rhodospirillaceae bacterium]MBT5455479.1 class I SAM-dependent methyltransferase [Rhodospirillaceae bacterium]
MNNAHSGLSPSPWVERFASLIPRNGTILDLACGAGRHTRFLTGQDYNVVALDRDVSKLGDILEEPRLEIVEADLENGNPWPLPDRLFSGIIVTNYLFRPLFPMLLNALAEDGVLIYETFALGNEQFGKPANPAFLLRPGELLSTVQDKLRVVAFEEGVIEQPRQAVVQRLCALRTKDKSPAPRLD